MSWLLWKMLHWTWECRYLFETLISFPLAIYLEVGLLGHMVVLFLIFLRNLHTLFHNGCTSLRSHQECTRITFSLYLDQHLLSFVFLIIAILTGVKFIVVLIWISLMICDAEHLFYESVGHLYVFFGKNIYSALHPFLDWFIHCFAIELCEFHIYIGY